MLNLPLFSSLLSPSSQDCLPISSLPSPSVKTLYPQPKGEGWTECVCPIVRVSAASMRTSVLQGDIKCLNYPFLSSEPKGMGLASCLCLSLDHLSPSPMGNLLFGSPVPRSLYCPSFQVSILFPQSLTTEIFTQLWRIGAFLTS